MSPRKDASDLFLVLRRYLNHERAERLHRDAPQLLDAEDFDLDVAGAWLAGHDAGEAINSVGARAERVLDVVQAVLRREIDADGRLELVAESGVDAQFALRLLTGFRDGMAARHRA